MRKLWSKEISDSVVGRNFSLGVSPLYTGFPVFIVVLCVVSTSFVPSLLHVSYDVPQQSSLFFFQDDLNSRNVALALSQIEVLHAIHRQTLSLSDAGQKVTASAPRLEFRFTTSATKLKTMLLIFSQVYLLNIIFKFE